MTNKEQIERIQRTFECLLKNIDRASDGFDLYGDKHDKFTQAELDYIEKTSESLRESALEFSDYIEFENIRKRKQV